MCSQTNGIHTLVVINISQIDLKPTKERHIIYLVLETHPTNYPGLVMSSILEENL